MSPEMKGKVRWSWTHLCAWWGQIIGWVALDVGLWHCLLHMSWGITQTQETQGPGCAQKWQPSPWTWKWWPLAILAGASAAPPVIIEKVYYKEHRPHTLSKCQCAACTFISQQNTQASPESPPRQLAGVWTKNWPNVNWPLRCDMGSFKGCAGKLLSWASTPLRLVIHKSWGGSGQQARGLELLSSFLPQCFHYPHDTLYLWMRSLRPNVWMQMKTCSPNNRMILNTRILRKRDEQSNTGALGCFIHKCHLNIWVSHFVI